MTECRRSQGSDVRVRRVHDTSESGDRIEKTHESQLLNDRWQRYPDLKDLCWLDSLASCPNTS